MSETEMSEQTATEETSEKLASEASTNAEEQIKSEEFSELEVLEKELAESKSKYGYLAAELDNSRKRFEREKENLLKFGNEKLLKELLEVVDNFERSLTAINTDKDEKVQNIVVGIEMVKKQFLDSLKKFGLEEVESVGRVFDPNFHEAVAQESMDGVQDDEVTKEYQKGYVLNGRLIRASKVVVNKK